MDVTSLMRRAAHTFKNDIAVQEDDRTITFKEAWDRGCRMANYLLSLGLKSGDRVAILEDNCLEASDAFLGVGIANLVRVPLYARNSLSTHYYMMNNTDCKAIIVASPFVDEIDGIKEKMPNLIVIVRGDDYESLLDKQSPIDPMIEIDPKDNYIIRHTGGTTGSPKAVAYTHWGWLACSRDWFYMHPPVQPGDVCLHVAPISHASGYWFIPMWIDGGRNIMVEKFDARKTLDILEKERVAYFLTVPTIMAQMVNDPTIGNRDFSAMKCLYITAAPCSDATALAARDIFGEKPLCQAYGQTEAPCVTFMSGKEWFAEIEGSTPLRSCGRVSPYAQLEIFDENNQPLPYGEVGQIAVQIDGQMLGYWKNPEATAERLVDGWVLTGDVGRIDDNGYVYLLDRADDMIVSGGYNIYPLELENVIHSHPAVLEAAVFGVPHEKWGEAPIAVVYLKVDSVATEAEIIKLCAETLGSYKKPLKVVFQDEPLPKTTAGKLRRKDLREPYWAGHDRRIAGG